MRSIQNSAATHEGIMQIAHPTADPRMPRGARISIARDNPLVARSVGLDGGRVVV